MSGPTELEIKLTELEDELLRRGLISVVECPEFAALKYQVKTDGDRLEAYRRDNQW